MQYVEDPEIKLSGIKKIVMLGDPGCTGFYQDSQKVLGTILKQKADLFFILGDLVFTGSGEEFREIFDFCNSRIKTPIYALSGNHDLPHYSKFLGLGTCALILDHHICLFLCNARGHFSEKDVDFLRKARWIPLIEIESIHFAGVLPKSKARDPRPKNPAA